MVESGFSRIPVYDGSLDNVIGVVYIKDALRLLEKRQPVVLRKILHPVHFVPETKKVGELLKELQKRRTPHGASSSTSTARVTGLVTLEDLLEEIVGEIQDEYDWEERAGREAARRLAGRGGHALRGRAARDATRSRSRSRRSSRPWPASCSTAWAPCRGAARSVRGGGLPPDRRGRREEPDQQGQDREVARHARPAVEGLARRRVRGTRRGHATAMQAPRAAPAEIRTRTAPGPRPQSVSGLRVDGQPATGSAAGWARRGAGRRRRRMARARRRRRRRRRDGRHLEEQRRGLAAHRERAQVLLA